MLTIEPAKAQNCSNTDNIEKRVEKKVLRNRKRIIPYDVDTERKNMRQQHTVAVTQVFYYRSRDWLRLVMPSLMYLRMEHFVQLTDEMEKRDYLNVRINGSVYTAFDREVRK